MKHLSKTKYSQLLTGQLEPSAKAQTVPDFAYNPLNQSGELYQPVIDLEWISSREKPVWPDGKSFAVCLTHDVDAVSELNLKQNLRSIWKLIRTRSKRPMGETLRWILIHKLNILQGLFGKDDRLCEFERWLELEEEYGAHSTFFFAPEAVKLPHRSDCMYTFEQKILFEGKLVTVAELMQAMDHRGWEVGLHPSWFAHDNVSEMISQKQQIENVLGHEIRSVRQHFLKFDPKTTPHTQVAAGFMFDSTLGYNDNVGFRRGSSYPFSAYDLMNNDRLPLLHIPLIAQDGALMLSEKGLRIDAEKAVEYVKLMLDRVKEVGGVLTLSWHPHTIHQPGFWEAYKEVLALLKQEDPWFATVGDIGTWWSKKVGIDLLTFTDGLNTNLMK